MKITPRLAIILLPLLFFPSSAFSTAIFGPASCHFKDLVRPSENRQAASTISERSQKEWDKFAADFQTASRAAISAAAEHYRAALAAGQPHARWLFEMGFRFGPPADAVVVPPLETLLRNMEAQVQGAIARGEIKPDQALRPARVFYRLGADGKKQNLYVPFGAEIPEGAIPQAGVTGLPFTLSMIAEGYFPLGENLPQGPRGRDQLGTTALHDLAHHSVFVKEPVLAARLRESARSLATDRAYYRQVPDIRGTRFTEENIQRLRERKLVPPELEALFRSGTDAEIAEALSDGPAQDRLNVQAILIQNGLSGSTTDENNRMRPLNPRALQGVRFTAFLEDGFQVKRADSEIFFNNLRRDGLLPARAGSVYGDHRFTVDELQRHLGDSTLSEAELAQALSKTVEAFNSAYRPIGGRPRDVYQNVQRWDQEPQGHAYYSMPAYFAHQAMGLLERFRGNGEGPRPTRQQIAEATARLQVILLEAGRFTPEEWLRDVTRSTIDPNSEVARFFTQTGAFPHDLYYAAYGGDLSRRRPESPVTSPTTKRAKDLASRTDIQGIVTEIGAAQPIARLLQDGVPGPGIVLESRSDYKTGASDAAYGVLGTGNVGVHAYASRLRLTQQLDTDFARLPSDGRRRFVIADNAETSRGNGHAWIGIKAELTPGGEPVTILVHARLLGERTADQQRHLSQLGLNLLYELYGREATTPATPFRASALLEGIEPGAVNLDFLSPTGGPATGNRFASDHFDLLRNRASEGIVFDPQGKPVSATEALATPFADSPATVPSPPITVRLSDSALAQGSRSPEFQTALGKARAANRPLLVLGPSSPEVAEFSRRLTYVQPRDRSAPRTPTTADGPTSGPISRAQQMNLEREYVLSVVDSGGRQGLANLLFDARNVGILFRSVNFRDPQNVNPKAILPAAADLSPTLPDQVKTLVGRVDSELASIESKRPHRKAVVGNFSQIKGNQLEGYVVVRGQVKNGGERNTLVVRYSFPTGINAQDAYDNVATLQMNALFSFSHSTNVLRDGLTGQNPTVEVAQSTGPDLTVK